MIEPRRMEFLIVHYALMHGQINVGIILFEKVQDSIVFGRARFIQDISLLQAFDPAADGELLQSLFREMELKVSDPDSAMAILGEMQGSFSNLIRVSDAKGILISGDPAAELESLASSLLACITTRLAS